MQDALNDTESKRFKLTTEEAREIKKLKRKGYKDFANAYSEYLQLEKQKGSLDYTLKEFCEAKDIKYRFTK